MAFMPDIVIYSGVYLFAVLISSVSQVLLKKAALRTYPTPVQEYLNPWVIAAYAIFFAATLLNVYAYKVVPLSLGPILESTSYFYVVIFGALIFHERLNTRKAVALALIIVGIILYSFGV